MTELTRVERAFIDAMLATIAPRVGDLALAAGYSQPSDDESREMLRAVSRTLTTVVLELREPGDLLDVLGTVQDLAEGAIRHVLGAPPAPPETLN